MNERLIGEALRLKAEQRLRNRQTELNRQQEAIRACPGLEEALQKRSSVLANALDRALQGQAPADLASVIEHCGITVRELLRSAGLPEDYLQPVYTCPICEDSGYLPGTPRRLCACVAEQVTKMMETEHAFENGQSFEQFDLSFIPDRELPGEHVTQRELTDVLRGRCERYADSIPNGSIKNLLLFGSSGLGKTYLLRCIFRRAEERGIDSVCVTASRFLRAARDSMFGRDTDTLDEMMQIPLLLIDDVGTEPLMQNITVEAFFNLLNERQNMNLCTVLSTNLSLAELKERYTERVFSRLMDRRTCQTLHFMGEDLRLK